MNVPAPVLLILVCSEVLLVAHFFFGGSKALPDVSPYVHLENIPFESVSHDEDIFKQLLTVTVALGHTPLLQVLVRNGEIPHITQVARSELKPGQIASENWHVDMYEVFLVLSGNGTLILDGEALAMTPGACIRVAPPKKHKILASETDSLVIVGFAVA
ncbi:hypothetical protein NDN08_005069 [Rhodosorus marinus]|uniref:Cupin type-2 domain-containing protein n=1 Tax=Rhodosorus marinus TaxID=101924 RepID=A0AAV8V0I5_9RHOD|nr:hypothetical protein NDN08_005069 [Rhodosorus marinus]